MADTVRKVDYYYVTTPDKPGEGVGVLKALRDAGVNLLAFHAFPAGRRAQLDFVPEDPAAFAQAARAAKLKPSRGKKAFFIQGEDRVGALVEMLERLASAGVNVTAGTALSAGGGRFGWILWVKSKDFRKASKALGV